MLSRVLLTKGRNTEVRDTRLNMKIEEKDGNTKLGTQNPSTTLRTTDEKQVWTLRKVARHEHHR